MNPEEQPPVSQPVQNNEVSNIPSNLPPAIDLTPPKKKGISVVILVPFFILIIAGLGIGSYLLFKPKAEPEVAPEKPIAEKVVPTPTSKAFFLTVESPTENTIIVDNKVMVKGKTQPGSAVAVFTESDAQTVESMTDGSFQAEIKLTEGINTISVTSVSDSGEDSNITFDVVFDSKT